MQEVWAKATGPRSTFATKLVPMKIAAEEQIYGAENMTADNSVEFQVHLSNTETQDTTWSITDTDCVMTLLESEIYGITSSEKIQFEDGTVRPLAWVWTPVVGNWHSAALETHEIACNTFWISKDTSCAPYIRVNSANGFWRQFHHQYVWTATYWQCERGISIYQQSQ